MNLLIKSIRWTQSCPRTGGGLLRRREDNMTHLILAICHRAELYVLFRMASVCAACLCVVL